MQEQTGLTHCLSRKAIFFPQGKDDPDLVLIRVEIERAEYWDGPGTIVGKIFSLAAAAITGNPGVMTDNAKVERFPLSDRYVPLPRCVVMSLRCHQRCFPVT